MRRYHEEKQIIERRRKEGAHLVSHEYANAKAGRYRKTHNGCNRASCQVCHPEKYPKRILTRKEQQAKYDERNHGWFG